MVKQTTINSMTGFARATGSRDGYAWNWEAKSVNGKGLDIRCRLPHGFDQMEIQVRNLAAKSFKRGNIALSLSIKESERSVQYRVNRELLDQLVEVAEEVSAASDHLGAPRLDGLLSVRGVVEMAEEEESDDLQVERRALIIDSLGDLLTDLADARAQEGERITTVLNDQLGRIKELCDGADKQAELQPRMIREKLDAQVAELLQSLPALPEERLAQEAALLMTKADIREELDRLFAHVEAARQQLGDGGVIGRGLDFLCQEFNREANTLCAKAADIELSRIGLELKATIEQFREQVQNIE